MFGTIAITQATLPVLIYIFSKSSIIDKLKRNTTYKWAWWIMVFGGLAVYGPMTMLYPFSYMGIGAFYVKVTQFMSTFNFVYNVIVTLMFYYASRLYLYEPDLKQWHIDVELYSYIGIVWIAFWSIRQAYWLEFEAFYLSAEDEMNNVIVEPIPTEVDETATEDGAQEEEAVEGEEETLPDGLIEDED